MNRRNFVTQAALVSSGLKLASASATHETSEQNSETARTMAEGRRLRVAVVGTGEWGLQHARVYSERSDTQVVAIVGRDRQKTAARAAAYNARLYIDLGLMLSKERPDFVSLALPGLGHYGPTLEVIRAGFPLLAEKPLTYESKEADQLISEAQQRKLFFAINFNHRYAAPIRMAREAIAQGRLGEITFATWRFGGENIDNPHPHANLIESQCHGFDQLEYLCGPINSLGADLSDKTGGGYRTAALSLRFNSGAVGSLLGTHDSSFAYRETHRLEINGTQGRILVEDTVRRFTFQETGHETAEVWEAGYFNDNDREFVRTFDSHVEEMLQALRKGAPPPVPAQAGQRALQLAWAAVASFEQRKHIDVSV